MKNEGIEQGLLKLKSSMAWSSNTVDGSVAKGGARETVRFISDDVVGRIWAIVGVWRGLLCLKIPCISTDIDNYIGWSPCYAVNVGMRELFEGIGN